MSLRRPVRYSEKINWRMVFDRRDLMVTACDKQAMKTYAAARIGPDRLHIPSVLWVGTDVRELADLALPEHWVLKPNAGTGQVHFGSGAPDPLALAPLAAHWLADVGLARWGEWGYSRAARTLLVEERIGAPGDDVQDWKFFVFDGEPALVQVDIGRFGAHRRRLYTPTWQPLPHRCDYPVAEPIDAPAQLPAMLAMAAELGAGFDHIRVDLYLHGADVWFSELTPYSGSGMARFDPDDLDLTLGAAWVLPPRVGRTVR